MHPITESPAMTIDHSRTTQLYWDTQDPENKGWSLRYWTEDGREHSVDIDAVEEAWEHHDPPKQGARLSAQRARVGVRLNSHQAVSGAALDVGAKPRQPARLSHHGA